MSKNSKSLPNPEDELEQKIKRIVEQAMQSKVSRFRPQKPKTAKPQRRKVRTSPNDLDKAKPIRKKPTTTTTRVPGLEELKKEFKTLRVDYEKTKLKLVNTSTTLKEVTEENKDLYNEIQKLKKEHLEKRKPGTVAKTNSKGTGKTATKSKPPIIRDKTLEALKKIRKLEGDAQKKHRQYTQKITLNGKKVDRVNEKVKDVLSQLSDIKNVMESQSKEKKSGTEVKSSKKIEELSKELRSSEKKVKALLKKQNIIIEENTTLTSKIKKNNGEISKLYLLMQKQVEKDSVNNTKDLENRVKTNKSLIKKLTDSIKEREKTKKSKESDETFQILEELKTEVDKIKEDRKRIDVLMEKLEGASKPKEAVVKEVVLDTKKMDENSEKIEKLFGILGEIQKDGKSEDTKKREIDFSVMENNKKTIEKLKEQIDDLTTSNAEKSDDTNNLNEVIEENKKSIGELKEQVKNFGTTQPEKSVDFLKVNENSTTIDELKEQIDILKTQKTEKNVDISKFNDILEENKKNINELKEKFESITSTKEEKVVDDFSKVNKAVESNRKTIDDIKYQIGNMKTIHREATEKVDSSIDLSQVKENIENNKKRFDVLRKELEEIKSVETPNIDLSEVNKEIEKNKSSVDSLRKEILEIREVESKNEKVGEESKKIEVLFKKLEDMKEKFDTLKSSQDTPKEEGTVEREAVGTEKLQKELNVLHKGMKDLTKKFEDFQTISLEKVESPKANSGGEDISTLVTKLEESAQREEEYNKMVMSLAETLREQGTKLRIFQKEFEVYKDLNMLEINSLNNILMSSNKKFNNKFKRMKGKVSKSSSMISDDLEKRMKSIEKKTTTKVQGQEIDIHKLNEKIITRLFKMEKRLEKIEKPQSMKKSSEMKALVKFSDRLDSIEKVLKNYEGEGLDKKPKLPIADLQATIEEKRPETTPESEEASESGDEESLMISGSSSGEEKNEPDGETSKKEKKFHQPPPGVVSMMKRGEKKRPNLKREYSVMDLSSDDSDDGDGDVKKNNQKPKTFNPVVRKKKKMSDSIKRSLRTQSVNWSDEEGFDFSSLENIVHKKDVQSPSQPKFTQGDKKQIMENLREAHAPANKIIPTGVLNSLLNDNTVVKEGWLHKETKNGNKKKWKKRFFRLYANHVFKFFLKKNSKNPLGLIKLEKENINVIETSTVQKKKKKHCITLHIVDIKKDYFLAAENEKSLKTWLDALKGHLM